MSRFWLSIVFIVFIIGFLIGMIVANSAYADTHRSHERIKCDKIIPKDEIQFPNLNVSSWIIEKFVHKNGFVYHFYRHARSPKIVTIITVAFNDAIRTTWQRERMIFTTTNYQNEVCQRTQVGDKNLTKLAEIIKEKNERLTSRHKSS